MNEEASGGEKGEKKKKKTVSPRFLLFLPTFGEKEEKGIFSLDLHHERNLLPGGRRTRKRERRGSTNARGKTKTRRRPLERGKGGRSRSPQGCLSEGGKDLCAS